MNEKFGYWKSIMINMKINKDYKNNKFIVDYDLGDVSKLGKEPHFFND